MKRTPLNQGAKIELNNREYTIDTVIGDGATCIVYSAYYEDNLGLPHRVNIKECYPYNADISRDGNALVWKSEDVKTQNLTAFSTAYKKLMSVQKGNFVVHAFDIDKCNGTLYIVMDANDGVTFDNDKADNLADILKTVKLLAYVVGEYHKRGYLHLDIKPGNFLIYPRPSDHIILFDLDTITAIEDIKSDKIKVCSYSEDWAAPEQKQGKISKLCPATDIYSIGAVLFEKIMGRKVVCGDSCLFADWDFNNVFFENMNPKTKRLLRNIFRKTLSANIKQRYQSADELVKNLEETKKVAATNVYLKGDDICCSGCFFGRQNELTLIKTHFNFKKKAVFLHGFGGIGKTEIARRYAEVNNTHYDTILFIKYNGNDTLQELINDINIVNFDSDNSKEKSRKLRNLFDEHTLIIIDNFDVEIGADNGLKALFDTKADILITTRTDFRTVYNGDKYAYIEIKELSADILEEIFITNAKITYLIDNNRMILNKIFKLIESHTYATELLAKQMWYSGWTIEELYHKIKSGFKSLEISERVVSNKDENIVKDNSLNILRAVYSLTDLNEDRKHVLRNLYLLSFMNVSKNTFMKYTVAGTKDIEALNDLVEIGLVNYDSSHEYYTLHSLIEELIKKDMPPTNENCFYLYLDIDTKIFNSSNYDFHDDEADYYEYENDCKFLCAFFNHSDLTNLYNRKLLLKWLLKMIEENGNIGTAIHSCFSKVYQKMSELANSNCVSQKEKIIIYYILLIAWLWECHYYYNEKSEQQLRLYFDLSVQSCQNVDKETKNEYIYKIYNAIITQANTAYADHAKSFLDIIPKASLEQSPLFSDMNSYEKSKLELLLNKKENYEIDELITSIPDVFKSEYIDDEIELERFITEGFYNCKDKVEYIKDIISDESYSPIKRAELIWYCTSSVFDILYFNYRRDVDIQWDWEKLEKILDLEARFLVSDKCNPQEEKESDNWNHYAETNTINKLIIYAATNNYSEYEDYLEMLLGRIGKKISVLLEHDNHWTQFLSIYNSFTFSLSNVYNALITLKKSHLILPYFLRYLNGWKDFAKKMIHYDDKVFFSLYKIISECAGFASEETVYSEKYLMDFSQIESEYSNKMNDAIGIDYSLKIEE